MTELMITLPADSTVLSWCGAVSVEHTERGSRGWRLPHGSLALFPSRDLVDRSSMQSGIRVVMGTDASRIAGRVEVVGFAGADHPSVDVVIEDSLVATAVITDGRFAVDDLPVGNKVVELWLPQFGQFWLHGIEVPADALSWRVDPPSRPRIVTYGSSITHCRGAASPARTWPALVARNLGLDLTCMGFGGQCHLDPLVAREIAALAPDVITACIGINIYGNATFNERSFLPAILGFVATVRDTCPEVPLLLISPIASPPRETTPNVVGFTLVEIRAQVAEAARLLRSHGDDHVHYLDGLDVFPLEMADYLPDDLHPDAAGYAIMADSITPAVKRVLNRPGR